MTEERKLVTVLFADIVGSTALSQELDPEVVRESLARTFAAARAVLEAHGGTVEKFIGDAVMAVFGVPTAHDDDADRAVRAAFVLHERVAALAGDGIPFEVRIGVNSGEAVAGTGGGAQFLVTGPVVNLAARLEQAAGTGEILVGPLTQRITSRGVRYDPPREIEAKGIGLVEAFAAQSLVSATPEQHRGIEGLRAPLVGRDRELRMLREAFERVGAEGSPSLVTVFGAAGSGKSRLMTEFTAAVDAGQLRIGRCLPYGEGITFYPIQQILRADIGIDLTTQRTTALASVRAMAEGVVGPEEAAGVAQRLAVVMGLSEAPEALPDVPAEDLMEELRWGVRRYLERRATAPLLLVFEDVHWAEPALIELVEHLAEWSRAPLLLICLARPDFREVRPTFGAAAANSTAITLSPLGPDDTRRLIRELLAIDALSEEVRADVITRAEGNPLYIEEFLRTLIETGRIAHEGGRWIAVGEIAAVEIPPTLHGLISARLDRVAPEVKQLLHAAAIVGRLFSTSALGAIAGGAPSLDLLREAARRDLIVEADERAPGEGRVHRFRHALFREVAYATIPKAERLRMHDNYGRWLEATLGERAEEFQEIVGYHAEQAHRYATELGRTNAVALGQRALALLTAAGDRARLRDDSHAAWKLYERAAVIAPMTGAPASVRAHVQGFAVLGRLEFGQVEGETDALLEEAIALARSGGPSPVLVQLLVWQALDAFNRKADTDEARRIAAEIPELARAVGDADLLAFALHHCGMLSYWWNDRLTEERFYLDAVEAARQGKRAQSIRLPLVFLARRSQRYSGDFAAAEEYLRQVEALDLGTSLVTRMQTGRQRAQTAYLRGDFRLAIAQAEYALAASREIGAPFWIAFDEWALGEALFAAGDAVRARVVLEHGAEIVKRLGYRGQIPELSARAARACLRIGDREAARAHLVEADAALIALDIESHRITRVAQAELAAADGDPIRAERILRNELARITPSGYGFEIAMLHLALGELLLTVDRGGEARDELTKARAFFHDPLAAGWQNRIDPFIARAEQTVS
ncbi:MAG: AAA family ATPase [Candidatus Limnocylindrales bacterium]